MTIAFLYLTFYKVPFTTMVPETVLTYVQYKIKHTFTLRPLFPRSTQEEEENAIENPRFHLSCSATPTLTLSSFNWRSDRSMRVGAYSRSRLSHNALIRRSFVPLLCPSFAHRLVRITSLPQIKWPPRLGRGFKTVKIHGKQLSRGSEVIRLRISSLMIVLF